MSSTWRTNSPSAPPFPAEIGTQGVRSKLRQEARYLWIIFLQYFDRWERRNDSQSSGLDGPWTCFSLFQYLKNTFCLIPLKMSKVASGKSKGPCTKIPWKLYFTYLNNQPGVYWFENLALSIKYQGMLGKAIEIHLPRGCIVGTIINNT